MAGIFSSLSVTRSALQAQGAALRTIGQNISNANTEGYTRQRVQFASSRPEMFGDLSIGTGVEITRIERILDQQLESSLRDAGTSLNYMQTQSKNLGQVETILNDLQDQGIGPSIDRFFAALNDLAARPEDQTMRRQLVAEADALADSFGFAAKSLQDLKADLNDEIITGVQEINRSAAEIAQLNDQIIMAEKGGENIGTANDLRDRRDLLIKQLSEKVGLKAVETSTGAVNVMAGGDWLVFGQKASKLVLDDSTDNGIKTSMPRFSESGKLFSPSSGTFGAIVNLRDNQIPEYENNIDKTASTLINQINRLHSQGEGLKRFTSLTGVNSATSPTLPLDGAGLPFNVQDGSFVLNIKNENTGQTDEYDIAVNLSGSSPAMSLNDLAQAINNAVAADHPEFTVKVTHDFKLEINSHSQSTTFGFQEDNSGVLAALGINTFFTGNKASNIGVNDLIKNDLNYFAAGHGGGTADNSCIIEMLNMRDKHVIEDTTIENWWQGKIGELGVERAHAKELAENQQTIYDNLTNQREALSGVNIDEETINLMKYQRSYQAAARMLSVIDSLIATLLQSV